MGEHGSGAGSCRCGVTWSGFNRSHCGAGGCHRTFTGTTAFDAHRRDGACAENLAEIGLVPRGELWGYPEMTEAEKRDRFGSR